MAMASSKRKWSEVFEDEDSYNKQSILDLCSSKLRYVNPARPPRRRTEVPLLRNVLIVNTMKHLSSEEKPEKTIEVPAEDIAVDPSHFEGLPPLSELLTDIMLDPHPSDALSPLPVQSSYLETDMSLDNNEDKVVHDLLPCTSVVGLSPQSSWQSETVTSNFDSYLSPSSNTYSAPEIDPPTDTKDSTFHSSSGPLPSFTSLFETSGSLTELTATYTDLSSSFSQSNPEISQQDKTMEDLVGNTTLTETELEYLAMAFSSKMPNVSFDELLQALPQPSRLQSYSYFVPSSLQTCSNSIGNGHDTNQSTSNPCGSYCRRDQSTSSDDNMVRVLVNL